MDHLCIFCGSSPGRHPEYAQMAWELGETLARRKYAIVYGGGAVGLMGIVARAALEAGGEVIGVIPRHLVEMELAFRELARLHIVESMHERKALMAEMAHGFIALPGGFGTIEELFEVLTWAQLGLHQKPCGLLNINGYYDKLIAFLDEAVAHQFVSVESRSLLRVDSTVEGLLRQFEAYQPLPARKNEWARKTSGI